MNFDQYKSTLPFATRKENAEVNEAYYTEMRRLEDQFKVDLLADLGLTGHPKADKVYALAWQRGHSSGYSEVYNEAIDLAELVL